MWEKKVGLAKIHTTPEFLCQIPKKEKKSWNFDGFFLSLFMSNSKIFVKWKEHVNKAVHKSFNFDEFFSQFWGSFLTDFLSLFLSNSKIFVKWQEHVNKARHNSINFDEFLVHCLGSFLTDSFVTFSVKLKNDREMKRVCKQSRA